MPEQEKLTELDRALDNIKDLLENDSAALIDIKLRGTQAVAETARNAFSDVVEKGRKAAAGTGGWLSSIWAITKAVTNEVSAKAGAVAGLMARGASVKWNNSDKIIKSALKQDPASVLGKEKFQAIATMPEFWKVISDRKGELADYIVGQLGASAEEMEGIKSLFSELIVGISDSIPRSKELVHKIMGHASVVASIKDVSDADRVKNLFGLLDNVIKFTEAKPKALEPLRKHQDVIKAMMAPYIPDGIDFDKVIGNIMKPNALKALKQVYEEYRDSKGHHILGLLKATKTMLKCPELRELAKHAMWKALKDFVLSLVPNFMRRDYANKRVNEILEARGAKASKDLSVLCKPASFDVELVTRHTLANRCFKGLNLPHNLNDLTINRFDFTGATLGTSENVAPKVVSESNAEVPEKHETDKPEKVKREALSIVEVIESALPDKSSANGFSLENSKVLNSSFKDVKFAGKEVNLSEMTIDAESLDSLLPSLKDKTVITDKEITIIGKHKDIEVKLKDAGIKQYKFAEPDFLSSLKQAREEESRLGKKRKSLSQSLKLGREAARKSDRS
jgi:hypothetical protein